MVGLDRDRVELRPHDPEWKRQYEREVRRLRSVAGDRILGFEHVGSTAVEGLAAKPIIDLLGVVEDVDRATDLVGVLESEGYEYRPKDDDHRRLLFAKGSPSNRTHYLKLTEEDTEFYRETVAFRDYLRENPEVAAEYERLKRDLADRYPEDRSAYTEAKAEFVQDVLDRALDRR